MLFLYHNIQSLTQNESKETYFTIKKVRRVDRKMQMESWRENQAFGEMSCLNATEYSDNDIRF